VIVVVIVVVVVGVVARVNHDAVSTVLGNMGNSSPLHDVEPTTTTTTTHDHGDDGQRSILVSPFLGGN
jgi:hypothetical protein